MVFRKHSTISMNNTYSRQSFDRFGDDFTQLLLSYLPIDARLKLECVSKQWQSLLFSNIFQLNLNVVNIDNLTKLLVIFRDNNRNIGRNYYRLNVNSFRQLLKKLRFLNTLNIDRLCLCDQSLIDQLCDNKLEFLRHISITLEDNGNISRQCLGKFCDNYGKQLTHLSINGLSDYKLSLILTQCCNSLRSIDLSNNSLLCILSIDTHNFPKLDSISLTNVMCSDFELFANKYRKQLRKLSICFNDKSSAHLLIETNYMKNALKLISCLEYLETFKLEIELFSMSAQQPIDDSLRLIGENCKNLRELDVNIFGDLIHCNVFNIFGKNRFLSLKQCQIALWNNENNDNQSHSFGTVECLKSCAKLEKLSLMFSQLCDKHLTDIGLFAPNVTAIKLNTDQLLTDHAMHSISKLNNLTTLVLEGNIDNALLTFDGVFCVIDSCSHIKTICIEFVNDINDIGFDLWSSVAEMTPHIRYHISYCDYSNRYRDLCVYSNLTNNLRIYKI